MTASFHFSLPRLAWVLIALVFNLPFQLHAQPAKVVIVVGAPGEAEFATNFVRQAEQWRTTAAQAGCDIRVIGAEEPREITDCQVLQQVLAETPKTAAGPLWVILLGHGTFDGKTARFNLRGPDFSAQEFAEWLAPFQRPLVVVNTASCSAPFINSLSGTNRVVVTATRSGHEKNFTRFGQFLADSLTGEDNDFDKDGQVSLLESFLSAARKTSEFYQTEGRIATEHALLDDNGDQQGTQADWFRGVRAVRKPVGKAAVDGLLARQIALLPSEAERHWTPEQRAQRDALERAVILHREKAGRLSEEEYYEELEPLLLDLARFYASNAPAGGKAPSPRK